ncbi:LptA/OstA family protein [Neorhizobium alkalisoli]|uniref:Lipopolysaccharide export system protein LptA n=1 Tax=Neorhizobium alkalisoli TaxID=528178 RepID=A0A561QRQ0_9HYPH|nr:LptA/OstA family protein [Neorhizobium alkalisoli]TWF53070.1 lipopolysaccharide export system protein LptA [Neorhizobium alkalisoli]
MITRRLHTFSAAVIAAGILSCGAIAAHAQTTSSSMPGMKLSNDQPIQIQSDQLEIKDQEKKAFFTGNVQVVQGTTTMKAGKMTVLYKQKAAAAGDAAAAPASISSGNADIDKIFLDDTVFLTSGTQQATADNGQFDMASQTFVLTGKQVVLSDGPNVFKGCKLTVQMQTGQAKLDACGGRVEIMLDPKSRPKQ